MAIDILNQLINYLRDVCINTDPQPSYLRNLICLYSDNPLDRIYLINKVSPGCSAWTTRSSATFWIYIKHILWRQAAICTYYIRIPGIFVTTWIFRGLKGVFSWKGQVISHSFPLRAHSINLYMFNHNSLEYLQHFAITMS